MEKITPGTSERTSPQEASQDAGHHVEREAHLQAACSRCRRCPLAEQRHQVVVSRGNPQARLMLVGEAPGAQEDATGSPFVGRSGQLLDQLLAEAGIDANREAYLANVVKCRPPGNRRPTAREIAACRPWLEQQIALVDPAVILLVGATAAQALLGLRSGFSQQRGRWQQRQEAPLAGRWLLPIFHPAYLLRNPSPQTGSPRQLTAADLAAARQRLTLL